MSIAAIGAPARDGTVSAHTATVPPCCTHARQRFRRGQRFSTPIRAKTGKSSVAAGGASVILAGCDGGEHAGGRRTNWVAPAREPTANPHGAGPLPSDRDLFELT